jgi:TonB-dependent receptor
MSIDHPVNYQFALGGQWKPTQALTLSGEFAYTHSLEKKTYRILNYATVPGDTWSVTQDLTGSTQSVVVDGANSLSAPGTFNFLNYSKTYGETGLQEKAGRLDAHYDLNDAPFFKLLSAGFRWNEVNFRGDGNNASAYTYTIADQAGNPISAAGSGLYTNAFSNFFRGNTNGVGGFVGAPVGILDNQTGLINAFPNAYRTIGGVKTYGIDGGDPAFYSLNHFTVTEKTYAMYGTTDFAFHSGLPVDGNVGVRVVRTDGTTLGYQVNPDPTKQPVAGSPTYSYAVPSTRGYGYTDVLPSLNVKVHLTDEWLVRFGVSKGMNRPGFARLSPAFTGINYAAGAYPVGTVPLGNVGNPDLKPAHSKNFDLALEYYFSKSGYAYVSTFYKKVTGFIINYAQFQDLGLKDVAGNPALALITAPINSGDGTIKGAEAGVQTFFDFLPEPFDGFGIQVNYTYVDSKQQVPLGPSSAPVFVETQLPNLSKNSYNVVGMYEKYGFTARLAWGYRTAYYRSQFGGGLPNLPLITPAYGTLDGSVSYDVNTQLSVSFDAANITNSAPDRYSGGLADRPVQNYTYDRRYGVGVRYRF